MKAQLVLEKANKTIDNLKEQHRSFIIAMVVSMRFQGRLSIEEVLGLLETKGINPIFSENYMAEAFTIINETEELLNERK